MRRSQKTKRVSWASDDSLCQVKFFLLEKTPSQVLGTDHLPKKASGRNEAEVNFPPGFGQIQPANLCKIKLPQIPLIKWRSPLRFEVNTEWEVVAGEESKEVLAQRQREMSVLEAIYPRPSSIPPNPCGLLNVEASTADDRNAPFVVPLTPIEEEEDAAPLDASLDSPTPISQLQTPISQLQTPISQLQTPTSQLQTSQAALTSILSNSGQGNLVDRDLLIKILNNPKMIEQLASSHNASSSAQNGTSTRIQNKTSKVTQYIPPSVRPQTNNVHMTKAIPKGPFYPPPPPPPPTQTRPPAPPLVKKDINYYKSLIQQHGRERQDGCLMSPGQNFNLVKCRESKKRILRPCVFYNSPKGCRNGANCTFQHDMSSQNGFHGFPEVHNAKRLKLDREIAGR